jgi:ActR/RegA family two-component response regulator
MASAIKTINSDIKLIIVTGYCSTDYHDKFSEIGANAVLTKPLEIDKLCAAIERCIAETKIDWQ